MTFLQKPAIMDTIEAKLRGYKRGKTLILLKKTGECRLLFVFKQLK